jgi:NAD(P)-dependent dehydrogenase (short-subunit alcohol dehydrogenase family)
MKIIIIGASGLIGSHVVSALSDRHEIVKVSRKEGDFKADITDKASLEKLYSAVGQFDAVVCCSGSGAFKPLSALSDEDLEFSLHSKLLGQINVVRTALEYISDSGSFTLTSGVLANEPTPGGSAISMINAGVEGFGRGAAMDLKPRDVRVNVVSPPWVSETLQAMGRDPGGGMPAAKVAKAFVESVENATLTGQVIDARMFA